MHECMRVALGVIRLCVGFGQCLCADVLKFLWLEHVPYLYTTGIADTSCMTDSEGI